MVNGVVWLGICVINLGELCVCVSGWIKISMVGGRCSRRVISNYMFMERCMSISKQFFRIKVNYDTTFETCLLFQENKFSSSDF